MTARPLAGSLEAMRYALTVCVILAAACNPESPLGPNSQVVPGLGEPFVLRIGRSAALPAAGLVVTFTAVPNDSRCPLNAYCVWAGDAEVRLTVHVGPPQGRGPDYDVHLHTIGPQADTIGVYVIRLQDLEPGRLAGEPLPEPYRVTLVVEEARQR